MKATYTHPVSGKTVIDTVVDFCLQTDKITVNRCAPQSTNLLVLDRKDVVVFDDGGYFDDLDDDTCQCIHCDNPIN